MSNVVQAAVAYSATTMAAAMTLVLFDVCFIEVDLLVFEEESIVSLRIMITITIYAIYKGNCASKVNLGGFKLIQIAAIHTKFSFTREAIWTEIDLPP